MLVVQIFELKSEGTDHELIFGSVSQIGSSPIEYYIAALDFGQGGHTLLILSVLQDTRAMMFVFALTKVLDGVNYPPSRWLSAEEAEKLKFKAQDC